ncbi:MAG: DNA cytosine methyltransferase [Enterobacter roggenkampii]
MRYLSLFSGIEAASVAWEPLGWEPVAFCEIEKFPCRLLAHRFPDVPNLGDITKIKESDIINLGHIDVVVFGSPCQDLSIGGKQKGLAGLRSGLFFKAVEIIKWAVQHCGCRYALWENVKGAFTSNKGDDFTAVVRNLSGCNDIEQPKNGWGTEGVALGDNGLLEWCVLDAQWFGLAQRRKRVFAILDTGAWYTRGPILLEPQSVSGVNPPRQETCVPVCLTARGAGSLDDRETYIVDYSGRIRHMTPLENERQMGFPDNWTDIPGAKDGPRYKALGNSMAVPVMRWIGKRISPH